MKNVALVVLILAMSAPMLGQGITHGNGDPTVISPTPNCALNRLYVDDSTQKLYLASQGSPCVWVLSGASGTTINPTNGKLPVRVNSTTFNDAAASDIIGAFANCSGVQYLGADGGCHPSAGQYITTQSLLALGDSITSKTSNGGTYGFAGLLALNDFPGWYLNRGLANDMAAEMALKCFDSASSNYVTPSIAGNTLPARISIMIGTNDATTKGTGSYQTGIYQPAHLACLAFLGIPRTDQIYMQDAAVTKAGGFAADNTVLSGLGEKVSANAATLTFSITGNGNPLEVTYLMKDAATGTFCVKIDGTCATNTITSSTTINSFGPVSIATTNGATTSPALARFAMSAGAHTIAITTTSAGENNILSAGVMPLSTANEYILAPKFLQWGVLRQQAAANEAATSAYDTQASTDCALMAGDGIQCSFVTGTHAAVTDACFTDAKHPADCGHEALYKLARDLGYLPGGGGAAFAYLAIPYIPSASPWAVVTQTAGAKLYGAQNTSTVYLGTNVQTGTSDVNLGLHNLMAENGILLETSGLGAQVGGWFTGTGELDVNSTGSFGFANATSAVNISSIIDSRISRLGAASFAFGNNTVGDISGTLTYATDVLQSANAAQWIHGQSSELLTIAAAATTDTAGNLLPANSIIEAVVVRVTTVIPTAATFTVGDATTAARFASGVAVAANTTSVGLTAVDQTGVAGPKQTAAAKVRITPNATPGAATGVVRITVFYRQFVAPTS